MITFWFLAALLIVIALVFLLRPLRQDSKISDIDRAAQNVEIAKERLNELKVDGGITSNNFIMQFLSDLLSVKITNIGIEEVSALGAAYLAGIEFGLYKSFDDLKKISQSKKQISPNIKNSQIVIYYEKWKKIIQGL